MQHVADFALTAVQREDHDLGARRVLADLPRGLDPVDDRNEISSTATSGLCWSASSTASRPLLASAQTLEVLLRFKKRAQAAPHDRVVVGQ